MVDVLRRSSELPTNHFSKSKTDSYVARPWWSRCRDFSVGRSGLLRSSGLFTDRVKSGSFGRGSQLWKMLNAEGPYGTTPTARTVRPQGITLWRPAGVAECIWVICGFAVSIYD